MGKMNAYSIRKIDDNLLKDISGGSNAMKTVCVAGLATAGVSLPVSLGFLIAGEACKHSAKKSRVSGQNMRAQKIGKIGRAFVDVSIAAGGLCAAGLITGVVPLVMDKNSVFHRYNSEG